MSSFLSCATTALSLFLLGVAFLVNLNLNFYFTVVQDQMEIQAYIKTEITEERAQKVVDAVRKLPGVSKVAYVSCDAALEELKQRFQDKAWVLEGLGDGNPLPASLRINAAEVAQVPQVVAEIRKMPDFDEVTYDEGT